MATYVNLMKLTDQGVQNYQTPAACSLGNVRVSTLRGFGADEVRNIIGKSQQ